MHESIQGRCHLNQYGPARAHCNPGRIVSRSRPRICGFRHWAMLNFPGVRTARSHIHASVDCNLHYRLLGPDENTV
jgi:hypothetical protein